MQTPSVRWLITALVAWLFAVGTTRAGLQVDVLNADDPIRRESVIPLRVKFTNDTPRVIEGRLETTIWHDDTVVVIHRSHELALGPGATTIPLLLPPAPPMRGSGALRTASLRFLGRDAIVDFGIVPLSGEPGMRQFIIAYVNPDKPKRRDYLLFQRLRMENFFTGGINTAPVWLEPDDLPAIPLAYCAYDFVVLTPEGFAAARGRQLAALARWVDGGGRVLVYAGGKMGEPQREFLTALARDETSAPWTLTPDGTPAPLPEDGIEVHPGLGAAALAPLPKLPEPANTATPEDATPGPLLAEDAAKLKPHVGIPPRLRSELEVARSLGESRVAAKDEPDYEAARLSGILTTLLPGAPRPIPISKVVVLMVVFIIVVVPCDYIFLGFLRRRRWTWVVFPLVAAGAGAWMMHMANRHMNSFEQKGTLRFVELGYDARVLRDTTFTVTLPAASRPGVVAADGAVALPMGSQRLAEWAAQNNVWSNSVALREDWSRPTAIVEGQLSGASSLHREHQQWTPCFHRTFSLHSRPDDSGLRWAAWKPGDRYGHALWEQAHNLAPGSGWRFTVCSTTIETIRDPKEDLDPTLRLLGNPNGGSYIYREAPHWLVPPTGTPQVNDLRFPPPRSDVFHILAIRRDGNDLTIIRKLHRLAQ